MEASQERALGRLEGKVDHLIRQQDNAEASRRRTHEQLDTLNRKQEVTQRDLTDVKDRLVAVEAPVAEFSRWKERWIGAVMLVGIAFTVLGAALSWLLDKLWVYLSGR